ncbi:Lipoprotein signal peptidase [Sphingomonas antarctica]|uniref:signal peptidase II n=1 Tax=Sphingomonas antarctica TaxID=2040274 RepID=UPI0039ED7C1B
MNAPLETKPDGVSPSGPLPAQGRQVRSTGLIFAAIVFFADQILKWVMIGPLGLQERGQIEIVSVFNFTWVQNFGVSLGMLTADTHMGRWLLVALTGAIAAGVLVWLWRETNRGEALALGAILGGALGNILDRMRLGYVVDFADLHFGDWRPFLVFNLADAAITLGVVVLLARAFFGGAKKEVIDA